MVFNLVKKIMKPDTKYLVVRQSLDVTIPCKEGYKVHSEYQIQQFMDAAYSVHELNSIAERPPDANWIYRIAELR